MEPPNALSARTEGAVQAHHHAVSRENLPQVLAKSIPTSSKGSAVSISWRYLTVYTAKPRVVIQENLLSQFRPRNIIHKLERHSQYRKALENSSGCVKLGEMLLIMGRSVLERQAILHALANQPNRSMRVQGDLEFGTMTKRESGSIMRLAAASLAPKLWFSSMTVDQTLDLAIRAGCDSRLEEYNQESMAKSKKWVLDALGIRHIQSCKIRSNNSQRGLSTQDRKLLVVAEIILLAWNGPSIFLEELDDELDAKTVTRCLQTIQSFVTQRGAMAIITLSRATEAQLVLFSRVLNLHEQEKVQQRPVLDAVPPPESSELDAMRKLCQNDTSCFESEGAPISGQRFNNQSSALNDRPDLEKCQYVFRQFFVELSFSIKRQFRELQVDCDFAIEQLSNLIQTLIASSLFYKTPHDTSGLAKITGSLFFAMLFHSLLPLKHIPGSFKDRDTAAKYGLVSRRLLVAEDIAFTIQNFLVIICQVSVFAIIFYFIVGLRSSASAFFTFWIVLVSLNQSLTSIFRFTAYASRTINTASMAAGMISFATLVCCGYVIAYPQMLSWYSWFFWLNPTAMAYSALISNELQGTSLACVGWNLAPIGSGYSDDSEGHQVCIGVLGASQGVSFLSGDGFLAAQSYGGEHIWRNVVVLWAYWLVFGVATTLVRVIRQLPAAGELLNIVPDDSRPADMESGNAPQENEVDSSSRRVDEAVSIPAIDSGPSPISSNRDSTTTWQQVKVATASASKAIFHDTSYINNRIILHIIHGLFNGFCFFHLPQTAGGIGLRQSTIFNFIFVATGVVALQQNHFMQRRRAYEESEEEKNKYGTFALACSLVLPELPYQFLCAVVYFVCWYYTVGLGGDAEQTVAIFLTMLVYELLYTSVGQFIIACVSDVYTAGVLLNPLIFGNFVAFCGILVPYAQLGTFWRSWAYWVNPFTYFIGSLLIFSIDGMELECDGEGQFVLVEPPSGKSCGEHLKAYLGSDEGSGRRLLNPNAVVGCELCQYNMGTDWLRGKNLEGREQGWRYLGIMVAFVAFFYVATFVVMQLRVGRGRCGGKAR